MARWIDTIRTAFSKSRPAKESAVRRGTPPSPSAGRPPVILARYDAVRMTGNRHRRIMDRGTEESEFLPYDRMYAITLGRDMHRNQARYVALEKMISRMTAGTVRCQVNTPDKAWNDAAERFFNRVFARDCLMQIPRQHLSELCQQLVASMIREGDVLVVFDAPGVAVGSGRLLVFEADQLVRMEDADFAARYPRCRQECGVIINEYGCTVGYIVSVLRLDDQQRFRPNTLTTLSGDKCLVFGTDDAVLLAARYRPGQVRGVPEMLPVSICLDDADEMVKSELLTSKMGSKNYATVYQSESTQNAANDGEMIRQMVAQEQAGNLDPATGQILDPDAAAAIGAKAPERTHYESIDHNDSAIVTYLEGKDRLDIQTPTRPNLHVDEFYRSRTSDAASALGIARGYGEMAVTNSYTAHRGESLLTWSAIYDRQKQLERTLLDWLATKVIEHGITLGEVPASAPADWSMMISWEMPVMPAIDERTAVEAQAASLKAGLTTYKELLGSEWAEKLEELAKEKDLIEQLGLPLAIMETVSGAQAVTPPNQTENTNDNN